jgi:hypothetical protein
MVPILEANRCEGVKRLPIPKSADPDEEAAHPEFRMSWSGRSDDCSLVVARFLAKTYDRGKDATTRCSSASAKHPTGCR